MNVVYGVLNRTQTERSRQWARVAVAAKALMVVRALAVEAAKAEGAAVRGQRQ
jgi:hypothetical protein